MKQLNYFFKSAFLMLVLCFFTIYVFGKSTVTGLVCEYHENPVGIDVKKPRLSWQIVSDADNMWQAAYEIRVAESISKLSRKSALIWNTEKVEGDKSVNIAYEGAALNSMQRVYW